MPNYFAAPLSVTYGGGSVLIKVADFNNDGNQDLVVSSYSGLTSRTVTVLLGYGNGSMKAPRFFATKIISCRF